MGLLQTFFVRILEICYWKFMKIALTRSIFELEFFFFLNGSEFHQKLISTIIRMLVWHLRAYSSIKLWQKPLQGEVPHQSPVGGQNGGTP